MIILENEKIKAEFAEKGAELQSLIRKDLSIEYIWNADPTYWGKHSPVLFPIVGGLKNNEYTYQGKKYSLGRHGFARDMVFSIVEKTDSSVSFAIVDSEETLKKYPFHFQFIVQYTLADTRLIVKYIVKNTSQEKMYFSVGAHPAFNVPLNDQLKFEDYNLQFEHKETVSIFPLDDNGQTKLESTPFLENTDILKLEKTLFYKDALVFKDLKSKTISIKSEKDQHGLTVTFNEFPYMGIWSAKDADFVCIEPWDGIADNEATNGKLEDKEGILSLDPAQVFESAWNISFF